LTALQSPHASAGDAPAGGASVGDAPAGSAGAGAPAPAADNPLLDQRGLPRFAEIGPEHVAPGIRALLGELAADLEGLEAECTPTWAGVVEGIERLTDRLQYSWGVVGHLMGVHDSPELRQAHDAVQPEVVQFSLRLAQSGPLYRALRALRDGPAWSGCDGAQRRVVDALILDAELAGIALEGAAKERFNAIQTELAEISTRFSNHVLDATKAFELVLTTPEEAAGLPDSLRRLAAQSARTNGHPEATPEAGPWRITLDAPSSGPFLMHSRRRDLREHVHRARITRASSGDLDNSPLIRRILQLRKEQAGLLGFATFAAYSLARKMAPSVAAVYRLEEDLLRASHPAAASDLDALRAFARERDAVPEADDMRQWDTAFWSERLREERYAFTEEELRPYFPLPRVLDGLFALSARLFGVTIAPADGGTPVWHTDAHFFRVSGEDGAPVAAFYLDPYSRPADKRGGAWMDVCVGRSRLLAPEGQAVRLPVAYLNCNGTPPVDGKPSLMTFGEVETLFHEFGHGLQHMLTTVDHGLVAGIQNVEWDAVELASQFMENWCYHKETLLGMTAHVDTGAPLPDDLFEKIVAARTYMAGSAMLGQIRYGLTDMELHDRYDPDGEASPFDAELAVRERTAVLPPLPEDRFLCGFTHIFAGGYAAGYYSYKWAEVLAADAFGAFEEAGLDDPVAVAATGRRYRDTVLSMGGSRHPMEVFKAFRGREPSVEPLLRQYRLA